MSVVLVAKDFKLFRRLKKKYMNSFLELQDIQNLNSGKIIKGTGPCEQLPALDRGVDVHFVHSGQSWLL